jgi:hypothetical protein
MSKISIDDWNNYIQETLYNLNSNDITIEQATSMLSQFIYDIINNNFENINQLDFQNNISQVIEKLTSFNCELSIDYLLDLTNKDTDQSIINRSILINILSEFYDIDLRKELEDFMTNRQINGLLTDEIRKKYNLLSSKLLIKQKVKNVKVENITYFLPKDILNIINSYLNQYELLNWIPKDKLVWINLSGNENAIDLLKDDYYNNGGARIKWHSLSENKNAIDILKDEYYNNGGNRINWIRLANNINAIDILKDIYNKNPNDKRLFIGDLSSNINAIDILSDIYYKNPNDRRINWTLLSANKSAIEILNHKYFNTSLNLEEHNNIDWLYLSKNENAIEILKDIYEKDPDDERINWTNLSANKGAIEILKHDIVNNGYRVNLASLAKNENAIEILKSIYDDENEDISTYLEYLSSNENAIEILNYFYDKNPNDERFDWNALSSNKNAIDILRKEYETNGIQGHLNLKNLVENENAIDIIADIYYKYPDKILFKFLSNNKNIFMPQILLK